MYPYIVCTPVLGAVPPCGRLMAPLLVVSVGQRDRPHPFSMRS
nr:MAG TPA: hypothetical protein [Caudoviricetes sp.]